MAYTFCTAVIKLSNVVHERRDISSSQCRASEVRGARYNARKHESNSLRGKYACIYEVHNGRIKELNIYLEGSEEIDAHEGLLLFVY